MAVQRSTAARNAMLDALEAAIGTAPKLQIRSGSPPASAAAADAGALLVEFTLPSDWAANAANGVKTWVAIPAVNAVATGVPGHYRLKNNAGTTTHEQGTVGLAAENPDVVSDGSSIQAGQQMTITSWSLTMPGG